MIVFIVALTMFFAASIVVYLLLRRMHQPWPPRGFPALPTSLWLSTLDIVFSSVTIQGAVTAAPAATTRPDCTGTLLGNALVGPGLPRPGT